ncbi:hypothetical protein ABT154_24045 [Streptomyces sp. NPDC001728]|uniref:DUF4968 domain-containing protein n=1 Tax=Streptomyces sp. NPDC001728 TaxID=3154396 RepID=UPI0033295DDB
MTSAAFHRPRPGRTPGGRAALALAVALVAAFLTVVLPAPAAHAATAGNVTGVTRSGDTFTVATSSGAAARVTMARADIFRIWLSPGGSFTDDPAGGDLPQTTSFGAVGATLTDAGAYYRIGTASVSLRINKSPLTFALYRADDTTLVWSESQPTNWTGSQTTQYLSRGADEQFYGTGLRLREWALRDRTVPVAVSNQWTENTNASPAPFYMGRGRTPASASTSPLPPPAPGTSRSASARAPAHTPGNRPPAPTSSPCAARAPPARSVSAALC